MTIDEAMYTLKNLQMLESLYEKLVGDPYQNLYTDRDLKRLIKLTKQNRENILEIVNQMECQDSIDQNTGKVHKIYSYTDRDYVQEVFNKYYPQLEEVKSEQD